MRATHFTLCRAATLAVLGAALAGCGDEAVPPAAPDASPALRPAINSGPAGSTTESPLLGPGSKVTVFTYDPRVTQSFNLEGGHRIEFPAGAVCDPELSTYGVTQWDRPCTPLREPITIRALSVMSDNGHPYVDFRPALRFVPGTEVVLYLKDKAASEDSTAVIQWCGPTGQCVEEPAFQPSYQTKRDAARGVVYRAIKHFSGYLISAGRTAYASF